MFSVLRKAVVIVTIAAGCLGALLIVTAFFVDRSNGHIPRPGILSMSTAAGCISLSLVQPTHRQWSCCMAAVPILETCDLPSVIGWLRIIALS